MAKTRRKARRMVAFTPNQARKSLVYVRKVAGDIEAQYADVLEKKQNPATTEDECSESMNKLYGLVSELEAMGATVQNFERCVVCFPARHQDQRAVILWRIDAPDTLTWRYDADHAQERPIETFGA